jgi:hypothetical protein
VSLPTLPPLPADGPGAWLSRYVCRHLDDDQRRDAAPTDRLVAGGWLREVFGRIRPDDPRRLHEINELSSWYPGLLAVELGFAFAAAAAAFAPTADQVRWVLHDGGWARGVVFATDTPACVLADHPWAGHPGVTVVASRAELRRAAMVALLDLTTPLVEHLVAVTGAGRYGLWHEVADGLPSVLVGDAPVPVTPELVADFQAMLALPGVPWRRRPTLQLLDEPWGRVCVKHRAGCCLAYLSDGHEEPLDAMQQRYLAELPEPDATRRYCLDCKFRTPQDSRARQLWWRRVEVTGA